ncbi:MAG: hypothetical protein KZQ90_16405 [Candidatus Thiodiazotropha sp. (ex Codakia rugifera)]|nr:hypothetical protein [Candidatus Thiodiazotropha sp. (ex Codakia rugifera)]
MAGNWGVRVVLPAGDIPDLYAFDPLTLSKQLASLKTPVWVMLNLSEGGYGGRYTSTNQYIKSKISEKMVPSRDLLKETIELLTNEGFKILIYYASDGPRGNILFRRNEKRKNKRNLTNESTIKDNWDSYLLENNLTNHLAIGEILKQYSVKFGNTIDGWWFDHAQFGDSGLFVNSVREGNEDTFIAWNEKHKYFRVREDVTKKFVNLWGLRKSMLNETYTAGHITNTEIIDPWSNENYKLIEQIENGKNNGISLVDGIQAHIFLPIQKTWRGGRANFPTNIALDWTLKTTQSCGAITWAIALKHPEFSYSRLAKKQLQQLQHIDSKLIAAGYRTRDHIHD